MIRKALETGRRIGRHSDFFPYRNVNEDREKKGSHSWIPFASYCTTGQFMKLETGFRRHCGPTAAVNLILTLRRYQESRRPVDGVFAGEPVGFDAEKEKSAPGKAGAAAEPVKKAADRAGRRAASGKESPEDLFLLCARVGRQTFAYWNLDILGRIGGTSNFLTGIFLRRCLRTAGLEPGQAHREKRTESGKTGISVRFHPWITPDAVEKALAGGRIVYLEVYRHPKYKNHHMLCYACRLENGARSFLLADGWSPAPVWTEEKGLGHGHFLTVSLM